MKVSTSAQFSSIKHQYEITFDMSSDIRPVLEGDSTIENVSYNFVKIKDIESMPVNQTIG